MADPRHEIEVVTTLGDTCLERAIVARGAQIGVHVVVETRAGNALRGPDGIELPLVPGVPVRIPCGLGAQVVTAVPRASGVLPRTPVDRRALAYLAASISMHVVVLLLARREPFTERAAKHGAPRPRLVANHTAAPRAARASQVTPSTHDVDERITQRPVVATAPPPQQPGPRPAPAADAKPARPTAPPGVRNTDSARHFDPCASGDCGLIATGRYATTAGQQRAGDYQLAPRTARPFASSVVTCTVDGGCNTVSGSDQGDLRTEIAHHVAELNGCFARDSRSTTAAVDVRIEDGGTVHVSAHDQDAVSTCLEGVIGKLVFTPGERDVTLAFAFDR